MDPVTTVVLAGIVVLAAPKAISLGIMGVKKISKSIKEWIKDKKYERRLSDPNYSDKIAENKQIRRVLEETGTMVFSNTKTGAKKRVNVKESTTFDINKDILLRGKVKVKKDNGTVYEEDIYLFQPRVYGMNNVSIGPKLDKKGHLHDKNGYLVKIPGQSDIYRGYAPKRDVITGTRFDFVNDSVHSQKHELSDFISIEIPKDKDGNYIPVNKQSPEEMAQFKKYIAEKRRKNVSQANQLDFLISEAMDGKKRYDYINRPRYARPSKGVQAGGEEYRVEGSRPSRARRDAESYYDFITRANTMDSIRREYKLGPGPGPMGPGGGPRGPMGPMGPGPMGPPPGEGPEHEGPGRRL